MVTVKAIYLITDDGFTIYFSQPFGETEQQFNFDSFTASSLEMYMRRNSLRSDYGLQENREGADMILESGKRVIAIAVIIFDKELREQEEDTIRNDLSKFVKKVEENYAEELVDPIFQKSDFSGVGSLVKEYFHIDG